MKFTNIVPQSVIDFLGENTIPYVSVSEEVAGAIDVDLTGVEEKALDDVITVVTDAMPAEIPTEAGIYIAANVDAAIGAVQTHFTMLREAITNSDISQEEATGSHSLPTGDDTISISATQSSETQTSEVDNGTESTSNKRTRNRG